MVRLKYVIILLLSAAVIAVGAFLPVITAAVQDNSVFGKVHYSNMPAINLNIETEKESLSIEEKLFLLSDGLAVDIDQSKASNTYESAIACVENALAPYFDAYLLPGIFNAYTVYAGTRLYYNYDTPELNAVFWTVGLHSDKYGVAVDLIIDDATGSLMHISANTNNYPLTDAYNDLVYVYDAFEDIYFSALGMDPELLDGISENLFVLHESNELVTLYAQTVAHYGGFYITFSTEYATMMQKSVK